MDRNGALQIAIVGAAGRPRSFKTAIAEHPRAVIAAICDKEQDRLEAAKANFGAVPAYVSFEDMLEREQLDAVIIGTPMHVHVDQAIAALERGLHVISEVPAAVSLDECKRLAAAAVRSTGQYIMAENCNYMKPLMTLTNMVREGVFGDIYYAGGEYLHEVKALNEQTPWRRVWQTGVNGITYGTHSLGPILDWMEGDRVTAVSCVGSGHHYADSRNVPYEIEDTCVMMAKTAQGRLIRIRLDMLSERPAALNYELQGTKGSFESIRYEHIGGGKVYVKRPGESKAAWVSLHDIDEPYIPDIWRRMPASVLGPGGHGGSDYVMMTDFLDALSDGRPSPISIHRALDMTLPGLISQQSIARGGEWLEVPDSRTWAAQLNTAK